MVMDILVVIMTLIFLTAATYQDLRTREVANWLSFGLLFAGLGIRTLFSFSGGWNILLAGLLGGALCYLIGWFFHATDQWGGGDTKLLMGMGMVLGFDFRLQEFSLLLFLAYLLFGGAVFGVFWCGWIAIRQQKVFVPAFRSLQRNYRGWQIASLTGGALLLGGVFFSPFFIPVALFPVLGFYLFLFMKSVEEGCFRKKCSPEQLVEGDWLADDVLYRKKLIHPKGTVTKADIWKLIEEKQQGKIPGVVVKEGIPFVPGFLLAFIALRLLNGAIIQWFLALL